MKTTKQEGTTFAGPSITNQHWIGDDICDCEQRCQKCGKRKKHKFTFITEKNPIRCCE